MFQNGTGQRRHSANEGAERRGIARREHVEHISLTTQWGTIGASLMDLSETGAQIRIANGLIPFEGEDVTLRLVDGHYLSGTIAWSDHGALGIVFAQALPALDDLVWLEQRGPDWFYASVRAVRGQ